MILFCETKLLSFLMKTIIDGDVRGKIKDDPHVQDLRYLRKRQLRRRQARIFSIFSLVRFKNTACTPSGTKNTYTGTCYLSTECLEKVIIYYQLVFMTFTNINP